MDEEYLRYIFDQEAAHQEEPCENECHGCKLTCCCGEYMENHSNPMDCGHSPVSMHDYYCCHGQRDQG
jgi:hypothetical protein